MTFDFWWCSREAEIAAEQSLDRNKLSILAAAAWNAALDAASRMKNPNYTAEDFARRLKELRAE